MHCVPGAQSASLAQADPCGASPLAVQAASRLAQRTSHSIWSGQLGLAGSQPAKAPGPGPAASGAPPSVAGQSPSRRSETSARTVAVGERGTVMRRVATLQPPAVRASTTNVTL